MIDSLDDAELLLDADAGATLSPRDRERYSRNLTLVDFSVDPGHGPCVACRERNRPPAPVERAAAAGADSSLVERFFGQNPSTGPAVTLISGFVALEAMRYLTAFATPISRGIEWYIDLQTGAQHAQPWQAWPDCEICARAPARRTRAGQGRAAASVAV